MSFIHNSALAGAGGQAAGGYEIEQSLRFNSADSPSFTRTPSSNGGSVHTTSAWIKAADPSNMSNIFAAYPSESAYGTSTTYDILGWYQEGPYSYIGNGPGNESSLYLGAIDYSYKFRDSSAWYHVIWVSTSTQFQIYVNGVLVASKSRTQNNSYYNQNRPHRIGAYRAPNGSVGGYINCYMAEVHFIDGQALDHEDFGEFDDNGVWRPIEYTGSYGTNGFYMKFDPSATNGIGHDHSGNGNDWTANNFTTSGTGTDVMSDTPTTNWATFNPLVPGASSFSNGNLTVTANGSGSQNRGTPFPTIKLPDSGKWYAEFTPSSIGEIQIGLVQGKSTTGSVGDTVAGYYRLGNISVEGSGTVETVASFTNGDVIGVIVNADDQEIRFSKNGTIVTTQAWDYSSAPNSSNCYLSFKQGSSSGSCTAAANYGAQGFAHTPPTGFKALNTANLPAPDIADGSQYFNTKTYTGNGSTQTITNVNFQPDLVWVKSRSQTVNHLLFDAVRGFGSGNELSSDNTNAEGGMSTNLYGYVSGVNSTSGGSFTVAAGTSGANYVNVSSQTYVGWNWLAANGTETLTTGSITSTVSANPSAGFSIVSYTGNLTSGATVGHGLGVAPNLVILKDRDTVKPWRVFHTATGNTVALRLNDTTSASLETDSSFWNNTTPSSTVITLGNNDSVNANNEKYIAYCFAEVEGYSKFGSYTGNGSSDGPFVYCGFKPAWILTKSSSLSTVDSNWRITDIARSTYNAADDLLWANLANQELANANGFDICSNGFKVRTGSNEVNSSGQTYVFAAFSEHPFGGSRVSPATAR